MATTLDQALQQLVDEGDVRISLYVRGITGIPGNKESCPIARYLATETGYLYKVGLSRVMDGRGHPVCWLPLEIEHFIEDFDNGKFLELDETEDEL